MIDHLDQQHPHITDGVPDTVDVLFDPGHQLSRIRPVEKVCA